MHPDAAACGIQRFSNDGSRHVARLTAHKLQLGVCILCREFPYIFRMQVNLHSVTPDAVTSPGNATNIAQLAKTEMVRLG